MKFQKDAEDIEMRQTEDEGFLLQSTPEFFVSNIHVCGSTNSPVVKQL